MEFHLILSVVMAIRTLVRMADRWMFGSQPTVLGFEFLLPDPLKTFALNPIFLPPLKRPIGLLVCWVLWFFPYLVLVVAIVPAISLLIHSGLNLPGKASDLTIWLLMACILAGLGGTWYLAYHLTKGVGVEFTEFGTVFSRNGRSVLVPWQAWFQTGQARRKSWDSSLVLAPCSGFQQVSLLGSSLTGTLIQGMPLSVDVVDGSVHLVLRDDTAIGAFELVEICRAIALLSVSK